MHSWHFAVSRGVLLQLIPQELQDESVCRKEGKESRHKVWGRNYLAVLCVCGGGGYHSQKNNSPFFLLISPYLEGKELERHTLWHGCDKRTAR